MTENSKLHRFFTVEYKGTIYFRFDTYGPEYTVWMKVDKADQVDNVDVYNFLERVYENVDLDIIKECRQTGKTRTTTKNLLEKAYYEQMTNEIDISKVLIEGDTATIMGVKYKRIEEPKSPAEEAYKRVYGAYPPTTPSVSNFEDTRWSVFQAGYNALQKSENEQQMKEFVRESVKWCEEHPNESVEDYLKPQTPEQTEKSLKEAFVKAQQTEEWKETQRKIDSKNPPEFLKFELGQNLTDLIYDWWEDVFTTNSNDDMETSINDLVERIKHWLPKEQSANSQNAYVECSVEGFNDCINKIRRKLR